MVCFLPWLNPNVAVNGISLVGNVFFVSSFRAPIVELSFFLSRNFAQVFFESTIASFDQSLCSGSPRGSMNLCNRIWMTELLHFYAYKFLSIIAMQSLWKSKHEKPFPALVQPPRMLQWNEPSIFAVMVVHVKDPFMAWVHVQGNFGKSVKPMSTLLRKPSAATGLTTGFFI